MHSQAVFAAAICIYLGFTQAEKSRAPAVRCNRLPLENINRMNISSHFDAVREWHTLIESAMKRGLINASFVRRPGERSGDVDIIRYSGPLGPFCNVPMTDFGGKGDPKRTCGTGLIKMRNHSRGNGRAGDMRPCVVYSVGSNNEWAFEETVFGKQT